MNTKILYSVLALSSAAIVPSCIPYDENGHPIPQKKTTTSAVTDPKQQELEAKREVLRKKELARKRELEAQNGGRKQDESTSGEEERGITDTTDPEPKPKTTPKNHPVAAAVPGKEGFVFSPFNNKVVDVRGIASGTLVADPQYPASEKKHFRVP